MLKTNRNTRKHVSQMNELEREFIMRRFNAIPKQDWRLTDYALKRFNEREIDPVHFLSLWNDPELIEYHQKDKEDRILLRSKTSHETFQVCAVFNFTEKSIVTVWKNWEGNHHDNSELILYNHKFDVLTHWRAN